MFMLLAGQKIMLEGLGAGISFFILPALLEQQGSMIRCDMEVTVYIVECSDGSYYTGLTKQQVEARVWEHNKGIYKGYTHARRPVKLVFTETYDRITDAIARERQIKGWNRKKKQALIAYAYEELPDLSRNYSGHPRPSTGSG